MTTTAKHARRLMLGIGLTLTLTSAIAEAGGRADRFTGNCRFEGYALTDPTRHSFSVRFTGTCTGQLNGRNVVEAPVSIAARGTSTDVGEVPVLADGKGVATLRPPSGRPQRIRFTLERLGLIERVTGACGGDSVVAVTPTSAPQDGRLTISGTMQTVTPLCG